MDEQLTQNKTSLHKRALLEAVLFAHGEPITTEKLFKALGVDEMRGNELLEEFSQSLSSDDRGLMLMRVKDSLTLGTKPACSFVLEEIIKDDLKGELTPAASETLSLVAYFGPISRAQIDFIRGVNSSFILRTLLMRGLIERRQGKGNAYEYDVSVDFLQYMGVGSREQLPEWEKYQAIKQNYFADNSLVSSHEAIIEEGNEKNNKEAEEAPKKIEENI